MNQSIRILIADDHEIYREGLRSVLAGKSDWVICAEAANGRQAVAQAAELQPDVAVLDFSMPELNGLETARQIRKASPNTEILMLTMHNSDRLAHEAISAGAKGFILKSDAKRHLIAAVEALSRRQTFFTSEVCSLLLRGYLAPENHPATENALAVGLTQREREIVQLIAEGKTTKEVARTLGLSEKTVETHRSNLMRKLDMHSVVDLVRYAIRNQLIEP